MNNSLNGTKLTSFQKNLSSWELSQKQKNYMNPEFFHTPAQIDPWKLGRMETQYVKDNIPSLRNMQFGFSAHHRNNKDANQTIMNKRILENFNSLQKIQK